jgi:hypothetical protein
MGRHEATAENHPWRDAIIAGSQSAHLLRRLQMRALDFFPMNADPWPDDVRLSDLEPLFVCKACGHRGALISGRISLRPVWAPMTHSRGRRFCDRLRLF